MRRVFVPAGQFFTDADVEHPHSNSELGALERMMTFAPAMGTSS
ncbi:hypothetical protein N806_11315 [Rhodococcus sp. P27]|nr:hypothetical protein N806_11315 [Rhodococcus sp. P27]